MLRTNGPAQAGCKCALRCPAASSGRATPIPAAPHHHAPVLQHPPHLLGTPLNLLYEALVSRVLGKRRRHVQNAGPVFARREGLFQMAGPPLVSGFSQRTNYNVVWLQDGAKTTRPNCRRRCCQPLVRKGVGLDCTFVSCMFPRTSGATP